MKKSILLILVCAVMLMGFGVTQAVAAQEVKIVVEGETIALDAKPVIYNGRVLVPVRQIVESMGGDVTWNAGSQTVHVVKDQKDILLVVNSNTAKVNNEDKTLDVPARIIGGRTMIPLRFVSENLDTTVGWDPQTYTVSIDVPVNFNNEAYDLLFKATEKSAETRQSKSYFKADMLLGGNSPEGPINFDVKADGTMKMDLDKPAFGFEGKVSVEDKGVNMGFDFEFRMIDNNVYFKDPTTSEWTKYSMPAESFAQLKELLNNQGLSGELSKKMMEQIKDAVRNIDFAGEKTVNGIETKGIHMEISGLKYEKMIKDVFIESGMGELSGTEQEAFDELLSGFDFTRYEVTYWIDKDYNIHEINFDMKYRFNIENAADFNVAFKGDVVQSEVNKPQEIAVPEVTNTL